MMLSVPTGPVWNVRHSRVSSTVCAVFLPFEGVLACIGCGEFAICAPRELFLRRVGSVASCGRRFPVSRHCVLWTEFSCVAPLCEPAASGPDIVRAEADI